MKKLILFLVFFTTPFTTGLVLADDIVTGATITEIGNTPDGTESFYVRTSG